MRHDHYILNARWPECHKPAPRRKPWLSMILLWATMAVLAYGTVQAYSAQGCTTDTNCAERFGGDGLP